VQNEVEQAGVQNEVESQGGLDNEMEEALG